MGQKEEGGEMCKRDRNGKGAEMEPEGVI